MPNYVYSNVRFARMNVQAREKFDLLCQRLTGKDGSHNFGDFWIDGKNVTSDTVSLIEWNYNNIGPKWTNIEYLEDDSINMTSAWSAPTEGVEWLIKQLAAVDPKLVTVYNYIEEQPAFAGFYVYVGEEVYDGYEDEWDEIRYLLEQNVEGLSDMKEDEDYTEEGWELFYENVNEIIEREGFAFIDNVLASIDD